MIHDESSRAVRSRLRRLEAEPVWGEILVRALREARESFQVLPVQVGYAIRACDVRTRKPLPYVLHLFPIGAGPMQGFWAAGFFKELQHDPRRISQGVCVITPRKHLTEEFRGWLRFTARGFDSTLAPEGLRRAVAFPLPDLEIGDRREQGWPAPGQGIP